MGSMRLFSPGHIGKLRLKNRGIMAPMSTGFANHDGTPSPRMIRYYEERAKGGVGAIITEYMGVDDVDSVVSDHQLMAARNFQISALEQLTEAVHRHDCLVFAQLHHGGNTADPALSGRQPLSPSDAPASPGRTVPRPMTADEIHTVVDKFIQAAERCKKAGYDGVEIHCAHSYLLGQFLSPYYNKRTDDYGGSLEDRVRIVEEIIRGIRTKLGAAYPILVRMSGDELTPDVPGTLTLQDGLEIAQRLEQIGIDALDISNGSSLNPNANCDPYSYQPGWKKHIAAAYKAAAKIPVIATNTIKTPEFAESLLEEGVCALLRRPDWPAAWRAPLEEPLVENARMEFTRLAAEFRRGDLAVEVCYDQGWIEAGGKRAPIGECELELKQGAEKEFLALVDQLQQALGWKPWETSKYRRAQELMR